MTTGPDVHQTPKSVEEGMARPVPDGVHRGVKRIRIDWQLFALVTFCGWALLLIGMLTAVWALIQFGGIREIQIEAIIPVAGIVMLAFLPAFFAAERRSTKSLERPIKAIRDAEDLYLTAPESSGARLAIEQPLEGTYWSRIGALERRVQALARATRALAVERERSRELATEQSRAKVQFFATMSHELRTPLNAILGYSTLLHEDASERGDAAGANDLNKIQNAGRRLLTLVDDLLELSGLQEGRVDTERGVFEVKDLVADIVDQCAKQYDGSIEKTIELPTNQSVIVGDRHKISRCVKNLIESAIQNAEGSAVHVCVDLDDAQRHVHFTVTDDGPALSSENMEDLLDGTRRLGHHHSARQRKATVGLTVARSLARRMGGDCVVVEGDQVGAAIRLIVPTNADQKGLVLREQAVEEIANIKPRGLGSVSDEDVRIALVVDDDPAARDLLERWLQRCNYRTLTAQNGDIGLALAKKYKPHIVLLDALMPGRTGYDVLAEMREDAELCDIPVLLVTVDDDRVRGLNAGASDYVRKPVSEAQLRAIVEAYDGVEKGKVLVIDDDDDAADLMQRNLSRLGYETFRATDGEHGLQMMETTQPTAIILDLNMPRLDGFDMLQRMAEMPHLAQVPVLVVSGHELSLIEHTQLMEAGARFFSKARSAPREIAATLREMVA